MLRRNILSNGLLAAFLFTSPSALTYAQGTPAGSVGWYNGDWRPAIPGGSNWYVSASNFSSVYDDFVVPASGWTVTGVFAHASMAEIPITTAYWEIRQGVSPGNPGTLVTSGLSPARLTQTDTVGDGKFVYLLEVTGLSVPLPAGTYWLNVSPVLPENYPVTPVRQVYICATLGMNAHGTPPGNNGGALLFSPRFNALFTPLQTTGAGGTSSDFSQGVLIDPLPAAPVTQATLWQGDASYLAQQMANLYSLPFPGISLTDFNAAATDLYDRASSLSDPEIRTRIQALVASIGDPHTDVGWPSPSPFRSLPLTFYWFDDGIYVTEAPTDYQELLGGKLLAIGNAGIDEATGKLTALVPHENDQWVKFQLPLNKLNNTDFLFGTGVTPDTYQAPIQVRTPSGDTVSATVEALNSALFPKLFPVYQGDPPLYRQHPDRHYWAATVQNGATVYFQYNSCSEDPKQSSQDFFAQLDELLSQDAVRRVIVDMRNNPGGFVSIHNAWIDRIKTSRFNQAGRLYVIVGRSTFSAAMDASDRFRDETAATFVGEPTGGKPRFMYRKGDFLLPNFGIRVSYSSGTRQTSDFGPTLVPDIRTGLTFADYMSGADPALEAILSIPLPE
jgi:hypothetical protein